MVDEQKPSFHPLSRGILEHIIKLNGSQCRLLFYFFVKAKVSGEGQGVCRIFAKNAFEELGLEKRHFYKLLKSLDHYLEVKYSSSRHRPLEIIIKRWKGGDFYRGGKGHSKKVTGVEKGTVKKLQGWKRAQYGHGKTQNSLPGNDLKKLKSIKKKKEKKSIKEKKENTPKNQASLIATFDLWYIHFPRKQAKKTAFLAFKKAISQKDLSGNKPSAQNLIDSLKRQLPQLAADFPLGFCPLPATWLNGQRWLDIPAIASRPKLTVDKTHDELNAFGG